MRKVLNRLRQKWKESDFQLSYEELVLSIPDVMEDLGIKPQE